jgi:hypothetical protein
VTTLVEERDQAHGSAWLRRSTRRDSALHGPARSDDVRRGETLAEVITVVWEDLAMNRTVSCPVCSGAMTPRFGSGPGPVGGSCGDCGSVLG